MACYLESQNQSSAIRRRDLLPLVALPVLFGATSGRAGASPEPWFRELLVGIEIGPTGANDQDKVYLSRATGKAWVDALRRANAQYGVVFMKDQNFAYYNSRIVPRCPGLEGRDLLEEITSEARSSGIPIVAYQQVQYDTGAWRKHPEWRMKDNDGRDIPGRLCYNSGYLDYNKRVADELMEYGIAGFHIDMLDFGFSPPAGCWCERCQSAFLAQYGIPMPNGVTWDERWEKMLDFRCASNAGFCEQIQTYIQTKKPGLSVDFNYHGYPPFSWYPGERPVMHAKAGDFVTAEGLPWVFGHMNPSMLSLFMQGARPGGPVQGVTSRSVYNYHDFTVRPVAELKWEVMTYLAHGAQCTIVDKANYDGGLDPVAYGRIGEVFAEARRKQDDFFHPPLQEVGLYYSVRSRDWYGREDSPKYMSAFLGAHKALVQAHIPAGFLMDENVTLARLKNFQVVYLPNTAILSPREVELLTRYVSDGGNLLATGLTGLFDQYGRRLNNNVLAEVFGADLAEIHAGHPDNYVLFGESQPPGATAGFVQGIPPNWPILTWGPVAAYSVTKGRPVGEVLIAHRPPDNPWRDLMSPEKRVGPAMIVNEFGKGKAILIPCQPDAAFIEKYRMPEHRNLIRNAVRFLNPTPPVVVSAPVNVETLITRDERRNRILVHLLAFWAPPTATAATFDKGRQVLPPMMEEAIEYTASIQLHRGFSKVSASRSAQLDITGRQVRITTPEIHEVVSVFF